MPAPSAGLEQRLLAHLVDLVLGWGIGLGAAYLLWRLVMPAYGVTPAVALALLVVVLVSVLDVVLVGLAGTSPGRALLGVQVVDAVDGLPIGPGRAAVRWVLVALAGPPSLGLGLLLLTLSALGDPEARRRAWHDRVAGSWVVDVRPRPDPGPPPAPASFPALVNLTLLAPEGEVRPSTDQPVIGGAAPGPAQPASGTSAKASGREMS